MASLFEALLGADNPVTQWTQRNSNLLTGLGTSLLSDGMNFQPAQVGATLDRQAAAQKEADAKLAASTNATKQWLAQNYPDLAQAVDAGLPVSDAWQEAFKRKNAKGTTDPYADRFSAGQNYGLQGDELNRFALTGDLPGANQSVRASVGQPVYMRSRTNPNEWGSFAPMSDGTLINQLTGQIANANDWVPDPAAATGARAGATVDAKTAASARAALPGAEVQYDTTMKALDKVTSDQAGLNDWFGQAGFLPRGMYVQGGSPMANWLSDYSLAEGQTFLQARQFLKGQGAITELESAKAEQAYSAMATAKQMGDKQKFLEAAADFRAAVEAGYRKLQETAAGGYAASTAGSGPQPGTVEGGYRFKGGDPGDPNNWEQVQ